MLNPIVVQSILEILRELPGVSAAVALESSVLELTAGSHQARFTLTAKIPVHQPEALQGPGPLPLPTLFIAPSIPKALSRKLQELGLFYADTAGNLFISMPGLYIVQHVNAPPRVVLRPTRSKDAVLNPSATRVALHLLAKPELAKAPLRQIAGVSGVALRSAQLAMEALCVSKCLLDIGKGGYQVADKVLLFRKFVDGFNQKLRHKLFLGSFAPVVSESRELELDDCNACWGGDVAADRLTHMLSSQEPFIYVYGNHVATMARNRLRVAPDGNVRMYAACWPQNMESIAMVAPLFVIYADLLYAQDPRCDEVAEMLYTTKIQGLLHE